MALSDCPDCWETPCVCKRGYIGSTIYADKMTIKKLQTKLAEARALLGEARNVLEMDVTLKCYGECYLSDEHIDLRAKLNEFLGEK